MGCCGPCYSLQTGSMSSGLTRNINGSCKPSDARYFLAASVTWVFREDRAPGATAAFRRLHSKVCIMSLSLSLSPFMSFLTSVTLPMPVSVSCLACYISSARSWLVWSWTGQPPEFARPLDHTWPHVNSEDTACFARKPCLGLTICAEGGRRSSVLQSLSLKCASRA